MKTCADSSMVECPLFHAEEGGSIPTSALQFRVEEISLDVARELNFKWHSRLPKTDKSNLQRTLFKKHYACIYNFRIYAVAIWTNPVAQNRLKDGEFTAELRRMAVGPDAPKNTPSRFLSIMVRLILKSRPDFKKLISYQDTEVHSGTIYKAAGWKLVKTKSQTEWNTSERARNSAQSGSKKNRWELDL